MGGRVVILIPLVFSAALGAPLAMADAAACHIVDVRLQPSTSDLQIVAWIEDAVGNYVDTIFITNETGVFGLGNRPGRFDFNSGPIPQESPYKRDRWPYGRRITVFPVWSHRHGLSFPEVVFQNEDETNLSHPLDQSSLEKHYCRPLATFDPLWDAGTCATPTSIGTDKGKLSATATTGYPPRTDLIRDNFVDSPSVDLYRMLDPFDVVSQATPPGGMTRQLSWQAPETAGSGDYVLWIEVSREFDFNSTYNATSYPAPTGFSFANYGKPYRGQPSIVYRVPFALSLTDTTGSTLDYAGYGDPNGKDGAVRPPDATITTDTPTSGASRLQLVAEGTTMFRAFAHAYVENDHTPPADLSGIDVVTVSSTTATLQFAATGDDGLVGRVSGYTVRVRANSEMTAANFDQSSPVVTTVVPVDPGQTQTIELTGLLPQTDYWVGVRAVDNCHNASAITIVKLTTADRQTGEVNACFIATAAYGSIMANDVEALRHFRDSLMRSTVVGELAIETYYTFGPAVAGVVGESELLRASARDVLAPIVRWVRNFTF